MVAFWALTASASTARAPACPEYAPNEILIKFREAAASALAGQRGLGLSAKELKLSAGLDELNAGYRLKEIKPVFKGFKENRQRVKALLKKDKATLTKKEKHTLRRLKRAPKGAKVPDLSRVYKIELDLGPGESLEEAVQAYNNHPDVEYAELNYVVWIDLTPNDALYPLQWALNNTGQMYPESGRWSHPPGTPNCDIDAPEAWDIHTGNSEVIVAVVDSGVDYSHRDLQGNTWVNQAELHGVTGFDDDGNGYVDDIYGYDFCTYTQESDSDPIDDCGHGTHCAGIIAAKGNNAWDITGVCWNAKIMAVKFLNKYGGGKRADAAAALCYAVKNGADVISNSWGGAHRSEAVEEAVNYAHTQGVMVVASAGNEYSDLPHYPGYYDGVLSVAATNCNDEKAVFSTYGDWVKLAAPGVDILSLRANGTSRGTVYDDFTTIQSGTSMACPHVSGASAMLLSLDAELSLAQLHNALTLAADPISRGICASGRLNLHAALRAPAGIVRLNKDVYSCFSLVEIRVLDTDLEGNGTQQVTVTTEGADEETVVLTESDSNSGIFVGAISTGSEATVIQDGKLQVFHGQSITVTYHNADDGTGNPAVLTDTAAVDCEPPAIFNVEIDAAGPEPTVTFATDELTRARILCGLDCSAPNEVTASSLDFATTHSIKLGGVYPETDYFFLIEVTDVAENVTLDDNGGSCYAFTTTAPGDIYVPGDYTTIQAGIEHCWDGGTVWVTDGVYTGEGNRDIDFRGKIVTVRSENGPENCIIDCNGSEAEPHRGFYFHSEETPNSVVDGFTITSGWVPDEGGGIKCTGAGLYRPCGSHPTIANCVITGNTATDGGGISYTHHHLNPEIKNCIIRGNTAKGYGGGIFSTSVFKSGVLLIAKCTTVGNSAEWGGGIYGVRTEITDCCIGNNSAHEGGGTTVYGTITDSIIRDNSARLNGGGVSALMRIGNRKTTVTGCIIGDNTAGACGGAFHALHGHHKFINCTITRNSAAEGGGIWLARIGPSPWISADLKVANCVVWDNLNEQIVLGSIGIPNSITYSNIQGGWEGEGNIDADPCFALETDCHLMPDSPCIDAGTNTFWADPPVTDMDGNPRILDGDGDTTAVIDMGAYEYNPNSPSIAVSASAVSFSCVRGYSEPPAQSLLIRNCGAGVLNWEIVEDSNWLEATPVSGESTAEVNEVTLTVDPNYLLPGYYSCILKLVDSNAANSPLEIQVELNIGALLCVPQQFSTIQAAIDAASDYDAVLLSDGVYTGAGNRDVNFLGKAVTVKSENGPEKCVIDCNGSEDQHHRGFGFTSRESRDSVLEGITIINGYSPMGGGIYCHGSSPTIANCVISCSALNSGGGIYCSKSSTAIADCTIAGCSARSGGGISCGSFGGLIGSDYETVCTVTNCSVINNSAEKGGGVYWAGVIGAAVTNCTISGNAAAGGEGGGIYCQGGSRWGPGAGGSMCVTNCLISGNSAENAGAIFCEGCEAGGPFPRPCNAGGTLTVTNSTITGNTATEHVGGLSGESNWDLTVANCILWANSDANGMEESSQLDGGEPSTNYCCIQGWTGNLGGVGNFGDDPVFVDPDNNDYHLSAGSPYIDAGDNNSVPADTADLDGDGDTKEAIPWDLDGDPRIWDDDDDGNAVVDMGAYEFVPPVEAQMRFTPEALNPGSRGKWVKAHLVLPEGYTVEDVDTNSPAKIVEPFEPDIESEYMNVFVNEDSLVEIEAAFDRGEFCAAGIDGNSVELTVVGSFTTGQKFYGTETIRITKNYLKYLADLASYWLVDDCDRPDWCGGVDLDQNSRVDFVDFALFDGCCIEIVAD
ncbi:MAG: S8 family serine peptidase [Planctomycetota bacterium]